MDTILLVVLTMLDIVLLGVVYILGKRQINPVEILRELTEERRQLKELRIAVQEELEAIHGKAKKVLDKVTLIGAEIETEAKSGREQLSHDMEEVLKELSQRIETPLSELAKKQAALQKVLKDVEKEKVTLLKALARGDRLVSFFNQNMPYEEVLEEIEDKKYADARELLSKGLTPQDVARELGMPVSEVNLIAAVA